MPYNMISYQQHFLEDIGYELCINYNEMFLKVPRHTNAYVSNKWPLKFPCAYLNTQGSCTTGTPLIRIQGG
ncbi:hypothetical protein T03_5044 [Trichinella britovi]|uniref:Uncharacterized protein n=1 Tax=Trichinella britovi TaxID=45882 RepID=A0A0V1DD34_TRIBR|nr:hypothetical protein T03_5044 [Trichinella britovi]